MFFLTLTLKTVISLFSPICPERSLTLQRIDSTIYILKLISILPPPLPGMTAKKAVMTKICNCNIAVMFRPF